VLLTAITSGDGSVGGLLKQMLDAATSTRASAAALATVQADTDDIQTRLPAALVGGALPAHLVSTATDVITSATLDATAGAELAAALLDLTNGVESSLTVREALRILFAFAAGNADGLNAASGTAHFKDSSGTKNRITSAKDGTSRTNTLDKT
jgi:hypothetical protein